ncbi:ABC transporter substrate-binding protein [Sphingobium sp. TCM1]|uniref:ABC transporter substrate-binding protein n=1 Tax=Sphingobium sp. TCM1 TaxID=453246 RepID=UPI0007F46AC0|nr:ABC transporter substrate-binding protein [Sphingobium sp. TCM1]OAN56403.1 iron ABC transporter [Sphingobium sp. TCM1]
MLRKVFLLFACLCAAMAGSGLLATAFRAAPSATRPPQRIVSLNLCADQLVLALADRRQIAGLTRNAVDTQMSAEAARARGLPILTHSAEQILAIGPDLVAGMPARGNAVLMGLDRDVRALDLESADRLGDIYRSIRTTAAAVGHRDRGEAMIARMQRELADLPRPGAGRVAAYYQRRGFMTGTGTLIDDLMQRMGLVNLAAKLGKPALAQVSLEEMVAARPDFLIVESATDRITDQGSEMLHHPALRDIPRISIPQAWTVCGGPSYARAARSMADQITRLDGAHR